MARIKRFGKLEQAFYRMDREEILKKQDGRCIECKRPITRDEATMDHIIPIKKTGGNHSSKNCQVMCFDCNQRKGCKKEAPKLIGWRAKLVEIENRLEDRIRLAEWRLSVKSMGSFRKWESYWEKRARWI